MRWSEIAATPTGVECMQDGHKGLHESLVRSYHILSKAKEYLARGVPADVLLELIAEAEAGPPAPTAGPEGGG